MRCIITYDLFNRSNSKYKEDSTAIVEAINDLPTGAFDSAEKLTNTTWIVQSSATAVRIARSLARIAETDYKIVVVQTTGGEVVEEG